ncbi:MAG: glycine zipper 2TM domain-containing protein [Pseudomonadales bacterium]
MIGARLMSTLTIAALVPSVALADSRYQYAQVVSSNPIYETVSYSVPVEQCRQERVAYYDDRGRASATGPILGAIIGGALGNAVGHKKRNKQVGTVVGAVLGGSIGADVARRNRQYAQGTRYTTEEVCSVVHEERLEEQLTGYRVTYRYAGETYYTTMNRDPGSSLRVRVNVTPVG